VDWVAVDEDYILTAMPVSVRTLYDAWIIANPDKAGRLAEITADTVMEFRAGIQTNAVNYVDADEEKLPQSCVRHCVTLVVYTLGLELESPLVANEAAIDAKEKAEVFLRQLFGRSFFVTAGSEGDAEGDPSYGPAAARPVRRLAG